MGLLTSASIVSSSFLLGVLFTSFIWDTTVLFPTAKVTEATIEAVENYYLTWWNGPLTVKVFLHVVVFILFMSLVCKFARKSETAYYFSGASLVLWVLNASIYIVITIPSIRNIARDPLSKLVASSTELDLFSKVQNYFAKRNTGPLGDRAREHAADFASSALMTYSERVEHVSVMCAGNTIAMVFLTGIILLQISEWYLEEQMAKEAAAEAAAAETATPVAEVTEEKKTQ